LSIRPAAAADVPRIIELIRELAEYERAGPGAVEVTTEGLTSHLFGEQPRVFCLLATDDETAADVVGFALWFVNYSTWLGRPGIYLEDLFVRPTARGRGLGRQLLTELARIAVDRDYGRLEWAVLDWNAPAIGFYRALGAEALEEWTTFRVTGPALHALAQVDSVAQ
jgi:GNAT superfamily N-acetyltransferase